MIPKQCDSCESIGSDKLSSLYWAWQRADHKRVAYKQKLCACCFASQVVELIAHSLDPVYACPACGISTVDDHDDVYLTYCVPGTAKDVAEMPLCAACAVNVRNAAMQGAEKLPDRGSGSLGADGGPQPIGNQDPWAALGLATLRQRQAADE